MRVLVTGGAGFIGSHTVVELAARGHDVTVVDSYANAQPEVMRAVETLAGRPIPTFSLDVRDRPALLQVFREQRPEAVIHFAAHKAVGESWSQSLAYYDNNVGGLLAVLDCMRACDVSRIVFSSSATVYGEANASPIAEDGRIAPANPYARTKAMCESILFDLQRSQPGFLGAVLRYFNPVGAHPSGLIGEAPQGIPNNLMPYICQVAAGRLPRLRVFGDDYPTVDGTGVRDYLHVMDLAAAHAMALDALDSRGQGLLVNLGTGRGHSVLEVIAAFARASGRQVPYVVEPRRAGDAAECYADARLAAQQLGWRTRLGLEQMCEDAWRWEHGRR